MANRSDKTGEDLPQTRHSPDFPASRPQCDVGSCLWPESKPLQKTAARKTNTDNAVNAQLTSYGQFEKTWSTGSAASGLHFSIPALLSPQSRKTSTFTPGTAFVPAGHVAFGNRPPHKGASFDHTGSLFRSCQFDMPHFLSGSGG